jgi:hypothetical protein
MAADQSRDRQLLSVVAIAHAQLPASALLPDYSSNRTEFGWPLQGRAGLHVDTAAKPQRLADLGRTLCYADNPRLAADAYAMALRVVSREHHAGRVFRDDLAETLVIPPRIYRTLQKEAGAATAQAA